MSRMITAMTASTRSRCINPPSVYEVTTPRNQSITNNAAIVNNIQITTSE